MSSAFPLPPGWGLARLTIPPAAERTPCAAPAPAAAGAPRAYDHHGVMLAWEPGPACAGAAALACDLEHAARFEGEADPAAADPRLGIRAWVATEVLAKLVDTPILAFVRAHGLVDPGGESRLERALEPWGGSGTAQVWLASSADGRRLAGFGMRHASADARERAPAARS